MLALQRTKQRCNYVGISSFALKGHNSLRRAAIHHRKCRWAAISRLNPHRPPSLTGWGFSFALTQPHLHVHISSANVAQLFSEDAMPLTNAQKLQALSVATPLALELSRQITANVGNSRRLKELGLGGMGLCDYVATSITTGPMNAVRATKLGMDTVLAPALTAMVNA